MPAVFLIGAALALGAPGPKEAPKDDKLVGEWLVESIHMNGKPRQLADEPEQFQFTADGKWFIYRGDRKSGGDRRRYAVNLKTDPPQIDLDPAPESKKFLPLPGIYKIEGDTLTICNARTSRGTRPAGFESTAESNTALYVFKRVKPKD